MGQSPPREELTATVSASPPAGPPGLHMPAPDGAVQRNNSLIVIAGVGVLLLAMGVGVLIGRSGAAKPSTVAPQVITVGSSAPAGATTPAAETSFTSDWPSGKDGYTIELQTLPQSATTASAVESAKSAASAKGAKAVGALKSEEFASLSAGSDVIYSGVYTKMPEAEKALVGLKKNFAGAKVIKVSNGESGATSNNDTGAGSKGTGSSESHPAPATVLKSLKGAKGKSYEEKSKALPDVVETG
jgi:hypothetical protein